MAIKSSLKKKSIIALGLYLCFFIATVGSITYVVVEYPIKSKLERNLDLRTELLATSLDESLNGSLGLLHSIAAIGEATGEYEELKTLLPTMIAQSTNMIVSGGIWPEPYLIDRSIRLNSLFYNKNIEGGVDLIHSWNNPESGGYNIEPWYTSAINIQPQQVSWSDVYIDPYTHVQMITASTPYFKNGKVQGVATIDISLSELIKYVQNHANQYDIGVLIRDQNGTSITEHNFLLSKNIYISQLTFGTYNWEIDVVNSKRLVAEETFELVMSLEFIIAPFLLACVMIGYYMINRYLIRPIVVIADKVSDSTTSGIIEMDYRSNDEIRHLIDSFNHNTIYLQEEKVKAQASTKAKSAFLATLSHEIRTPMNGVLGTAQILAKTDLNDHQKKLLHSLYDSGEHMMTLLNEILDFSKIEQGKLELDPSPFPLSSIIGSINSVYYTLATEKGLSFKVYSEVPTERWYNADKARMRQILFNLLNNAIKFTSRGFVEVYLNEYERDGKVYLSIQVRDTGIGISKSAQEKIFKPFEQAESSTTRRFGGTGLGLAITQKIVQGMGGNITVKSEEGIGSSFFVSLQADVCEPESTQDTVHQKFDCNGLTALIVEDNRTNTMIMDAFLRSKGFETTSVVDGAKAVDILSQCTFDLVLMDNHMPVMDGIEATERIRNLNHLSSKGLILGCTADVFKETREKMLKAGADHILAKPIDERELDDVLIKFSDRLTRSLPHASHSSTQEPQSSNNEKLLVDLYVSLDNQDFEKAKSILRVIVSQDRNKFNNEEREAIDKISAALEENNVPSEDDINVLTLSLAE
ncbi:putative TWO-COMPONENT SENSOR PROTEIN HISTIDINE PROTEIN KINASE [Vibrio nigripulchritudo MADA3029]|uniref:hybrid sensor histidine kinase/response regulator n=1 Tax=Vibrio nigripulchritudo TaxID=28173 RepID=UPI0003B1AFE0|nr:hybrid sensor histidine kinase/response regulator [Vibrio nigripulchritudo]CCN48178.1 putative TWO-COMPONENT SENSOR PROTEIN HISTIDINE PROTEIN KINASE [Vibrio nigripulchritudo MADA3020]CCN54800.1 putative TWO-COMPONENT SENSOR PROTEIN HISTIDINE PROTEIN KINASE [Vibrio nigripulchritudo MADA3021]CCN58325.1 putative TWO-COMPONENT SENSOR PROTEIN HISTIDINE PROTEIN KINASE [Vibrio nigripulchritudo MADA3029]